MAVINETVETVLSILGATQYATGMASAAAGAGALAAAETGATAATEVLAGALSLINPVVLIITAVFAGLVAAIDLAKKSLEAFSEESKKLFETSIVFKNLGISFPIKELREFANENSRISGLSRSGIEGAAGMLARTGINANQIKSILPTILDTARSTGASVEEVASAVAGGIAGHTRELRKFKVEVEDTGSKAGNLARIQQQLALRFQGGAAGFADTLPGAIERLQNSFRNLFSDIGERLAPKIIPIINLITRAVDWLDDHLDSVIASIKGMVAALNPIIGLMMAVLGHRTANQGDAAARVGKGGDPATERTAMQIADNTRKVADTLEQRVLGGPGIRAGQAATWRDMQMAMRV